MELEAGSDMESIMCKRNIDLYRARADYYARRAIESWRDIKLARLFARRAVQFRRVARLLEQLPA